MAETFYPEKKLEKIKMEVIRTFDELYRYLSERKDDLLSRLDKIKENYVKNSEIERSIEQMRISKNQLIATMTSNLIGGHLDTFKQTLDREIELKTAQKVPIDNLGFVEFRCYSEKIRKAIKEIDLYELSAEYVERETPVLTACSMGSKNGELINPKGITLDRTRNEVYICDNGNSRIQVLSADGNYLRQFGKDQLTEPFAICLSQKKELFVTDEAKECILKFSLTGEFVKQVGSRGNKAGEFNGISGICCEAGLVYVCDFNVQRIQLFDSELNYVNKFSFGELSYPTDIKIFSGIIYILPQDENCIYCYNIDCTLLKKIELTGQENLMTGALFFTIDKKGNFLVTDQPTEQIRIFSPKGVLKQILGTKHLPLLCGITLDNLDRIICVCHSKECFITF